MRIHFIAIGGSAMHNLALALYYNHHTVTGSDDEIYNPARDRLAQHGLLPPQMGWHPERIHPAIDAVILGMHARKDNPELQKALALNIPVYSYPAYLYEQAKNKTRVVIAGSHGKTTTTSMIMHVLRYHQVDFDYMVGAQLEGFERMVRLSDAPLMVIEGDEYLSSPIDDRPKFLHYRPHLAVITGIAWDHINVFPTFEGYLKQFEHFAESMEPNGRLFYYQHDPHLQNLATGKTQTLKWEAYDAFEYRVEQHQTYIRDHHGQALPLKIFGAHNLQNLKAAHLICRQIGLSNEQFFSAIRDFRGAAKRLQLLVETNSAIAYQDFAHAPSKVKATIEALKAQYPDRRLLAALELHTFSSLNRHFLKEYASSMQAADQALVFFSEHTLRMKKLPMINTADIQTHFAHPNLKVIINDNQLLVEHLQQEQWLDQNLLLMSSGTFGGLDLLHLAKTCLTPN